MLPSYLHMLEKMNLGCMAKYKTHGDDRLKMYSFYLVHAPVGGKNMVGQLLLLTEHFLKASTRVYYSLLFPKMVTNMLSPGI